MRCGLMPSIAAASRSWDVAISALPARVRHTNHPSAPVPTRLPTAAASCGPGTETPPSEKPIPVRRLPRMARTFDVNSACAAPRRNINKPNVTKICDSSVPRIAWRTNVTYASTPNSPTATADSGTERSGSSPVMLHAKNATYIPTMTNSPWAKLTTSTTPKINVSPTAIRERTAPSSSPLTTVWAKASTRLPLGERRQRPHHVGRRVLEGPDQLVLAIDVLKDHALRQLVLAAVVETDPVPRHDRLLRRHVDVIHGLLYRLGLAGARFVDRLKKRQGCGELPGRVLVHRVPEAFLEHPRHFDRGGLILHRVERPRCARDDVVAGIPDSLEVGGVRVAGAVSQDVRSVVQLLERLRKQDRLRRVRRLEHRVRVLRLHLRCLGRHVGHSVAVRNYRHDLKAALGGNLLRNVRRVTPVSRVLVKDDDLLDVSPLLGVHVVEEIEE